MWTITHQDHTTSITLDREEYQAHCSCGWKSVRTSPHQGTKSMATGLRFIARRHSWEALYAVMGVYPCQDDSLVLSLSFQHLGITPQELVSHYESLLEDLSQQVEEGVPGLKALKKAYEKCVALEGGLEQARGLHSKRLDRVKLPKPMVVKPEVEALYRRWVQEAKDWNTTFDEEGENVHEH